MAFYEVVLNGSLDGQPCLTVLHYEITGSTDLQAFVDAFDTAWTTNVADYVVNSLIIPTVTIREDVPGGVGNTYIPTGGQLVGAASTPDYFAPLSVLVRKLAATGNRPAQGRIFQGGIPHDKATGDGSLNNTYRQALATAWEELIIVEFDTSGLAEMVIKATNPTAPNTVAYNPVSSMQARSYVGKQWRRNYNS